MEIKFYNRKDLERRINEFCDLSHICFTAQANPGIIRQRYIENPYEDLLMCIAEDEGRIVANYSVVPIKICVNGEIHKAALSLNTMTHPQYEGKGLFVRLASSLYDYMDTLGYAMVCGFPNNLSNGIFCAKLGWKDIYEIPTMELRLHDVSNETCRCDVHPDIGNWQRVGVDESESEGVTIFKENKYLIWRYRNHKTNKYVLSNFDERCWAIHHVYGTEMNITEMHYGDNVQMLKKMVDYYISLAVEQGCEKLTTWAGINTPLHSTLERKGFINRAPVRYFGGRILAYQGDIDLLDYDNWTVYMGDDNVY
ncbi:MAG: GNAT family N-acetyltransferase [Eubacteriales bacterium]|nr:GNAT family N-acetyltransferase [Eubacteriales bacterium]